MINESIAKLVKYGENAGLVSGLDKIYATNRILEVMQISDYEEPEQIPEQGLSAAVGMALAGKMKKKDYRVYAVTGDGEIQEGQIWEAAMFAGARKLDNLVVIVDNNNLQIDGAVSDVCSPYPIDKKFEAFNFHVINIDGNDFDEIRAALKEARETKGMPTAIIAKTIKGKGVSFMEDQAGWHGKAPNDEEYRIAMDELEKAGEALCRK